MRCTRLARRLAVTVWMLLPINAPSVAGVCLRQLIYYSCAIHQPVKLDLCGSQFLRVFCTGFLFQWIIHVIRILFQQPVKQARSVHIAVTTAARC